MTGRLLQLSMLAGVMGRKQYLTLIQVTWIDADAVGGWHGHDPGRDAEADPLQSYGLLVSQNKHFLTLSFAYNQEAHDWLGKHRIPMRCLVGTKIIKKIPLSVY